MADDNPFLPPEDARDKPRAPLPPGKKPLPPKVIGVLGLCFGALSLFWIAVDLVVNLVQDDEAYGSEYVLPGDVMALNYAWNGAIAVVLCVVGVGLVRYRKWARHGFNAYVVLTVLGLVGWVGFTLYSIAESGSDLDDPVLIGALVGGAIGGLLGLVYPLVGVLLLNQRRIVDHLD